MHKLDAGEAIGGAIAAFTWGMRQRQMRRQAYVQAVIEGRERDALHRRIAALERQVAAASKEAVDRRVRQILTSLPG